ncbi:hypothetical protein [Chromobacterium violaceum]|nr:hypothetical protein [Chromobacterium violaceum]
MFEKKRLVTSRIIVLLMLVLGTFMCNAYAGIKVTIQEAEEWAHPAAHSIYQCPNGYEPPAAIPQNCQYDPGAQFNVRYRFREGACIRTQRFTATIERVKSDGTREKVGQELENTLVHAAAVVPEKILNLPTEPGTYVLHADVHREEWDFMGIHDYCYGDDAYRWFRIKEIAVPDLKVTTQQGSKTINYTNSQYNIPYGERGDITFTVVPKFADHADTTNKFIVDQLKVCDWSGSKITSGGGKDGEYFSANEKDAILRPQFIKGNSDFQLHASCQMTDKNNKVTVKKEIDIDGAVLHRVAANFGSPRLQWNDNSNQTKEFTWADGGSSAAGSLRIKAVSTQPNQKNLEWAGCDITGSGTQSYSFSETIRSETGKALNVPSLGQGQTEPGGSGVGGNATFSGVCYEDKSHWDYYSQSAGSLKLERLAPRILNQDTLNKKEVAGTLTVGNPVVHPSDTFSIKAAASLSNFYPGVQFSLISSNSSVASITGCGDFGVKSNNLCLLSMSATGSKSGDIALLAASKDSIKLKTQFKLPLSVQSRDFNDVSNVFQLDSKTIDIMPQITVQGRSDALEVKIGNHPVNATNIVLHQGRELNVELSKYRLIGAMPGGGDNGQTSGKLDALNLSLPTELDKTAKPKWGIADAAVMDADAAWTGHEERKLNSQPADYKEGQLIKMTAPIKITGEVAKKVNLKISARYSTAQAEILNPAGTSETDVAINIGDKLLPANQVFSMDVNHKEDLQLSHNPPNNLGYFEVHFKTLKKVSGVDVRVDLPDGLQRGTQGELQLLRGGAVLVSTDCPNSCLNNAWVKSGAVVSNLATDANDEFNLKIPVELETGAPETLKPIDIAIEQNDEKVDQDTAERVVEWKTQNSVLKASKPVVVKSREQVAVNGLEPALQMVQSDEKSFKAVVDVMNADASDKVTLVETGSGKEWEMKAIAVNGGAPNLKRYEATVPMLKKLTDTLTVKVQSGSSSPVTRQVVGEDDVKRSFACNAIEGNCTVIWQGARVPYSHSATENGLKFDLSSLGHESWFDGWYQLSPLANQWDPVTLFEPKNYKLPLLDSNSEKKTDSFMRDGTLPQEGSFHFDYNAQ